MVTNYNRQLSSKHGPYSFCTVASLEFDVSWTNVINQLLTQLGGLTRQHSIFCLDVVVFRLLAKKVKQLLLESEMSFPDRVFVILNNDFTSSLISNGSSF